MRQLTEVLEYMGEEYREMISYDSNLMTNLDIAGVWMQLHGEPSPVCGEVLMPVHTLAHYDPGKPDFYADFVQLQSGLFVHRSIAEESSILFEERAPPKPFYRGRMELTLELSRTDNTIN